MFNKVFHKMYSLPKTGIFTLVNEKKKCIYISYSRNLITAISRNIKEMKDKVHVYKPLNRDIRDWKFSIIETLHYEDTILDISCKVHWYMQEYRNLGYEIKTHKNICLLRFRVDIGEDYKVYCKLITKGHNEYVVGVFNNLQECKYLEDIYRNMNNIIPVYAFNDLTKMYIETLKRR